MNIETLREYCLSKKAVTEDFPFDDVSLVFKVGNKMFLLTTLVGDFWINLKCDPEIAIDLRERYPAVSPGYHMSKVHWNTIYMDGSISDKLLFSWIDNSYELVVKSLTKKIRAEIGL